MVEEVEHDALAELAVTRFFVHIKNLLEGGHVDVVAEVDFSLYASCY